MPCPNLIHCLQIPVLNETFYSILTLPPPLFLFDKSRLEIALSFSLNGKIGGKIIL